MRTLLASQCGLSVEAEVRCLYEPFRTEIVGWNIGDGDRQAALWALRDAYPKGSLDELKVLGLRLMAKTKRQKSSVEMDGILLSEIILVMREFPLCFVEAVVNDWHKHEGDQAIFTPAIAVLNRELEAAAHPYTSLVAFLDMKGSIS